MIENDLETGVMVLLGLAKVQGLSMAKVWLAVVNQEDKPKIIRKGQLVAAHMGEQSSPQVTSLQEYTSQVEQPGSKEAMQPERQLTKEEEEHFKSQMAKELSEEEKESVLDVLRAYGDVF